MLPAAIDREIRIAFVPSADRRVVLHRLDTAEVGEFDLDDLPEPGGTWLDYPVGMAWALAEAGLPLRGLRGVIGSNLPAGAGLSSSAAIELATAQALLAEADRPEPMALARLAQRAENGFVGVQSGLMDQFAVACGRPDAALLLDCRSLAWRPVGLPLDEARLVICDSGETRRLTGSEYNTRRDECRAAVAVLAGHDPAVRSLRDVSPALLDAAAAASWLNPVVLRRAQHVVAENQRVLDTVDALERHDLAAVGLAFAA
ncbi:MAG: galactokinase, partial [Candidatus Limnocylindrales bacterium]